jgi:plasmid maintenance system antidote protein VapI
MTYKKQKTPVDILEKWTKEVSLTDSELSRALGYLSNYIYLVKSGRRAISFDFIGRLVYTYGIAGPGLDMAEAMKAEK